MVEKKAAARVAMKAEYLAVLLVDHWVVLKVEWLVVKRVGQ